MLFFTLVAVTAAAGLYLTSEHELVEIIFTAVADAYIQVSTFVAGTFLLIYGAEKFLNIDAVAARSLLSPSLLRAGCHSAVSWQHLPQRWGMLLSCFWRRNH